jgi:choline dehydrogenase-like flavoprotein
MGASAPLQAWGAIERDPERRRRNGEEFGDYVRRTAITYRPQVGTCTTNRKFVAVVNPKLRVVGVEGLRVADACVMRTVPTGNTNAPSSVIGERVPDLVAGGYAPGARIRRHGHLPRRRSLGGGDASCIARVSCAYEPLCQKDAAPRMSREELPTIRL